VQLEAFAGREPQQTHARKRRRRGLLSKAK